MLVSQHSTAWNDDGSHLGAMRVSGEASMENVVVEPFQILFSN